MTTQTLTLLTPLLPQGDASWFLWHNDQRVCLAQVQPQDLLLKGEVESFIWWTTDTVAASLRSVPPQDLLKDYASALNLQLSPSCSASQAVAASADEALRAHHVELELRVTRRVAARLFDALGLTAPVAENTVAPAALDAAAASPVVSPQASVTPAQDPFGTFEQRFRFWLASAGIQGEAADKVCAVRRIAGCLRDEDSGDLVRDLPSALYCIGQEGREAQDLLRNPAEMLRLMTFLRN